MPAQATAIDLSKRRRICAQVLERLKETWRLFKKTHLSQATTTLQVLADGTWAINARPSLSVLLEVWLGGVKKAPSVRANTSA